MQSSAATAAAAAAATAAATTGWAGAVEEEVVDEEEDDDVEEDDGSLLGLLLALMGVDVKGQLLESSVALAESVTEILLDLALVSMPVLLGASLNDPCRDTAANEPSGVSSFGGAVLRGVCASSKSSVHDTESLFSMTNFIIEEDCCCALFLSKDNE